MLTREIKLTFSELEELATQLWNYQAALEATEQQVKQIGVLLGNGGGSAYLTIMARKELILDQIRSCKEEAEDLYGLLSGYINDMKDIICPRDLGQQMVVDRNDIWANLVAIESACNAVASIPINVGEPGWDKYTKGASQETIEKERGYYKKVSYLRQELIPRYASVIRNYNDMLTRLYEEKVIAFENRDDEYEQKVLSEYYGKYTTYQEFADQCRSWHRKLIGDFAAGAANGIKAMVMGPIELIAANTQYRACRYLQEYCIREGIDPPQEITDPIHETEAQTDAILNDPFLLLENMAQDITDTAEEKGISYCIGYIAGPILVTKGAEKAIQGIKGLKASKAAKKAAGTVDDAAGGAGAADDVASAGALGSGSGTGTVDDFIKNNVNPNFQQNVKDAFLNDAKVTVLKQDMTVYRYHGGSSQGTSYWYTPNQTSNPAADLALPQGNTYQYMDTCVIPKGTTVLEGTVAPNFGQPGGGYQFYVPDPSVVIKQ